MSCRCTSAQEMSGTEPIHYSVNNFGLFCVISVNLQSAAPLSRGSWQKEVREKSTFFSLRFPLLSLEKKARSQVTFLFTILHKINFCSRTKIDLEYVYSENGVKFSCLILYSSCASSRLEKIPHCELVAKAHYSAFAFMCSSTSWLEIHWLSYLLYLEVNSKHQIECSSSLQTFYFPILSQYFCYPDYPLHFWPMQIITQNQSQIKILCIEQLVLISLSPVWSNLQAAGVNGKHPKSSQDSSSIKLGFSNGRRYPFIHLDGKNLV